MIKNLYWCLLLGSFFWATSTTPALGQELSKEQVSSGEVANELIQLDALNELGTIVERYIENGYAVGGELLVIEKGVTRYHRSFGFSDREDERKWQNDTVCNIRSMTKPITSAAAQILIDRGELELDVPVSTYLESFDNDKSRAITVRQVLTHRSGLPLTNLLSPTQYPSLAEQVAAAGKTGPQFEPGSKFWYSDTGTDVVGRLIEKISGELLSTFVEREILDPLGMSDTFYGIEADDVRLSKAASGYVKNKRSETGWTRFWTPEKPLYPFAWGSQTLYSTTTDYARFLTMMINEGRVGERQLISTEAVARMLAPVSAMNSLGSDKEYPTGFRNLKSYYGQMMLTHRVEDQKDLSPVVIGHSGSDGTNAWAWPEKDLIILYYTQSRGGRTVIQIEQPIDRLLINPTTDEQVPDSLKPYLGKFIANFKQFENEEFTVFCRDNRLTLDVPSQTEFELLEPDDKGNWAFAKMPDEIKLTFIRNEKDEVIALKLHQSGESFEVPRAGSKLAKEQAEQKKSEVDALKTKKGLEKLKEAWVGELELGEVKPVMQFRIVTMESGETAVYFDSVTEGKTNFDATWSVEGDQLNFDVTEIGLTFRGKLNEAADQAEGTWSQGGRSMPLILKKQDKPFEE